jgi:hypothetical protein
MLETKIRIGHQLIRCSVGRIGLEPTHHVQVLRSGSVAEE